MKKSSLLWGGVILVFVAIAIYMFQDARQALGALFGKGKDVVVVQDLTDDIVPRTAAEPSNFRISNNLRSQELLAGTYIGSIILYSPEEIQRTPDLLHAVLAYDDYYLGEQ
ncbi:MAG: hypothetical protein H6765_03845 [Candidatus Peribacteria bacterium]|nr:MAG: hypothetical protein H6765_03845 [Candidatus Peribacteria bacterium]